MNKTEWVWKHLQRGPAHPPITLPYTSPGHAPFCFPFLTFYSLFLFSSCLENLNCLTYHPQTPRNCAVESCGRGCACTGFAAVNYLTQLKEKLALICSSYFCSALHVAGMLESVRLGLPGHTQPAQTWPAERAVWAFFLQPHLTTPDAVPVTGQALWLPTWSGTGSIWRLIKEKKGSFFLHQLPDPALYAATWGRWPVQVAEDNANVDPACFCSQQKTRP